MPPKQPSVAAVLRLRAKLVERVALHYYQTTLVGQDLENFVDDLMANLPAGPSRGVVFSSAAILLGSVLQPRTALEFCWRLAGNVHRLKAGQPVLPWAGQQEDEWVPMQVLRTTAGRNKHGKPGYFCHLGVLAGTPCTMTIDKFWTKPVCTMLARRIGFTKPDKKFPFVDPVQLVGMRFVALIDAQKSKERLYIGEIKCSSGCLKHNKDILKIRYRVLPCPNGWTHHCHRCCVGYLECPAATHRETYVEQFCTRCGQKSFFDPETRADVCVNCLHIGGQRG